MRDEYGCSSRSLATIDKVDFCKPVPIPLSSLTKKCNPFVSACWHFVEPILEAEVADAIQNSLLLSPEKECENREQHIQRIAWFVVNGWNDCISIDVGVPALGCYVDWPVVDGNHRLAAAIYREDVFITSYCSGDTTTLKQLMLDKNCKRFAAPPGRGL